MRGLPVQRPHHIGRLERPALMHDAGMKFPGVAPVEQRLGLGDRRPRRRGDGEEQGSRQNGVGNKVAGARTTDETLRVPNRGAASLDSWRFAGRAGSVAGDESSSVGSMPPNGQVMAYHEKPAPVKGRAIGRSIVTNVRRVNPIAKPENHPPQNPLLAMGLTLSQLESRHLYPPLCEVVFRLPEIFFASLRLHGPPRKCLSLSPLQSGLLRFLRDRFSRQERASSTRAE